MRENSINKNNIKMKKNITEFSNSFKIEELQERLEFVIDAEALDSEAWGKEPGTIKAEVKVGPDGKPVGSITYEKKAW